MSALRQILGVAVAFAGACSDSTPPSPAVARIVFGSESALIGLHGTATLAPIVLDGNDNVIATAEITWTSSDISVATVDNAGVVNGVTLGGPVTITATIGDIAGTVRVRVVPGQIIIAPALSTLEVGLSATLSAQVLDALGAPIPSLTVTWTNQSPTVVSLDQNTLELEALSPGIASVTATAAGRATTMSILVGVVSAYDGAFVTGVGASSDAQLEVVFGRITRFTATLRPSVSCSIPVTSLPNAVIAQNGAFSFGLSGTAGIVVGTFTSTSLVNGVVGSVPNVSSCGIPSSTGTLPNVGFTALRP